jgi:RND family efflux transporter MFP subunit
MKSVHPSVRGAAVRLFVLLFVAGPALTLAAGCRWPGAPADKEPPKEEEPTSAVPQVTVVQPERKTVRRSIRRPGYNVEPYQSTAIFAKISGYVGKWSFDIGDPVRKGQIMVELLVPEMEVEVQQKEAAVVQAQAEIKQARAAILRAEADRNYRQSQYTRLSQVGRTGVLDKENVEEYRFALEAAKAALAKAEADVAVAEAHLQVAQKARDYARTLLRYTKVPAPFDGVVTRRNVNDEDLVHPSNGRKGDALYVVDQIDPVRVFVNVPETEAVHVSNKDEAIVRTQLYRGRTFTGTVTRTAQSLDPATRTLRTEIDLPNPKGELVPGMYVDVTITPQRRGVWTLPETAVVVTDEGSYCYRLENGKAVRTPLQLGLTGGGLVEVLKKQVKPAKAGTEEAWQDITGEEQIIKSGLAELKDGQAVQVSSDGK